MFHLRFNIIFTGLILTTLLNACSNDGGDKVIPASDNALLDPNCESFDSTYEAIQTKIFEAKSCSASACHGEAKSGGLDLRPDVAYENLIDQPSQNSSFKRIDPGAPKSSFLYQKLQAATNPGSVNITGSAMPVGASPLTEDELEAVRVWIASGAPRYGSVGDPGNLEGSAEYVNQLLGVCLPESQLVEIPPLDPPGPEEGIQFRMPDFKLDPTSQYEGCFASYYDFSDQVPERFKSADGSSFYINGTVIRQDAASHHLVIMDTDLGLESLDDEAYGEWQCQGGISDGQACDPAVLDSCGEEGICRSTPKPLFGCIGYGPLDANTDPTGFGLGTALQAQLTVPPVDGAYREVPIKGIIHWNLHAFNLTKTEAVLHARMNLTYTNDLRFKEHHKSIPGPIPAIAPYTKQEICGAYTFPKGAELIRISSHTHRHGQYFWIDDPEGNKFYENFYYSDPAYLILEEPMHFDSDIKAERTLKFCAIFNNGINEDGTFNDDLVTKLSRTPDYSPNPCTPVACTEGKVGEPCNGIDDHDSCDTSPGAGDGFCDACNIQFGVTTEDEMFFMLPDFLLPTEAKEAP